MKKKLITVLLCCAMSLSIVGCGENTDQSASVSSNSEILTESSTESPAHASTEKPTPTETLAPTATPTDESVTEVQSISFDEILVEREEICGTSNKNIDDISVEFSDSYKNDATGNWRLAKVSSGINMEEYALSYCKKYFKDKKEIHVIIDSASKITSTITYMGGILEVSSYEYTSGEEQDASLACSGTLLSKYWVYSDNGDIERIL